jgi:hypothetical protein
MFPTGQTHVQIAPSLLPIGSRRTFSGFEKRPSMAARQLPLCFRWEKLYIDAILETDDQRLRERVRAVEEALSTSVATLTELEGHLAEMQRDRKRKEGPEDTSERATKKAIGKCHVIHDSIEFSVTRHSTSNSRVYDGKPPERTLGVCFCFVRVAFGVKVFILSGGT